MWTISVDSGMVLGKRAVLDRDERADRADGVLVDGIDVIHVVLHLRHDAAEIGDEAAEHAGLVDAGGASSPVVREVSISMNRRFASGSSRSFASISFRIAPDQAQRIRMDVEPVLLRQMEQADACSPGRRAKSWSSATSSRPRLMMKPSI